MDLQGCVNFLGHDLTANGQIILIFITIQIQAKSGLKNHWNNLDFSY